ncbi:MAG: LAGLIDADG family homing endonuclease, partial [archaeon]
MTEKQEIGTIVSTLESPTPSKIDFVVMNGKAHRGQFVEIPFSEGLIIGMITNVRKTNKYFERADAVKEFEQQGTKLFEQFPVNDWEYTLAEVNPLGIFVDKKFKRISHPPSPGTNVFNAQPSNIIQFLGLDEEKGMHLGEMEFHPVSVKLNLSRMLQKHIAILAMSGAGKCAKYDTKVLLANGEQRMIGEIVDEVLAKHKKEENGIESWEEDSELYTYSLFDNKIIPSQIRGFHRRKAESIITLTTRSGKKIEVTPEHVIPVFRGKIEWIKAGEATQSDYLITPRAEWKGKETIIDVTPFVEGRRLVRIEEGHAQHKQSKNRLPVQLKVDEDLAELMAYWLAEGHNSCKMRIDFTNENKNIQANYFRIVKEKFSMDTKKDKHREQFHHNHALLSKCLPKIGFTNSSWTKFIPKEILQSKKNVLMAFLAAFIDCDGHVEKEKPEIEITLSSKELTNGIREILTKLGIIYISKIKKYKGKEYQRTFISGSDEIRRLRSLNLRINYKKEALERWCNTKGNPNVDIVPNINNHISELLNLLHMSQPQNESSRINN